MGKLVKFADVGAVPPGKAAAFTVEGQRIAVFNVGGALYALEDTCPHAGAPLSEGLVTEGQVVCPWHDAAFDLQTGAVLSPPAFEGVRSYKVVVEGGDLKLEL